MRTCLAVWHQLLTTLYPPRPLLPQVLDLSRAAAASDMRPSRLAVMAGAARAFIRRFFDLNPLGQLGLAVLRGGVALRLTELSGSPEAQVAQLAQYGMDTGGGWGVGVGVGGGGGVPEGQGCVAHVEVCKIAG